MIFRAVCVAFIITSISFLNFEAAQQLKKYHQLISQADEISAELNTYFYSGTDVTRQGQLQIFQQKALPELKAYAHVAVQLDSLILPAKERKLAKTRSRLITLECRLYQLLFAEFEEQDYTKYRPEINEITKQVNILREGPGWVK